MIFIDQTKINVDKKWTTKAKALTKEALGLSEEVQKSRLQASNLWTQLRPELEATSFGKCWYCESKSDRALMDIDHFRPKNAVRENKEHRGYYWLALDWKNYRVSCQFCNRPPGKSSQFPLIDETKRAFTVVDDIDQEQPAILDPTIKTDTDQLWFMEDGFVVPRIDEDNLRAIISIKVYDLNQSFIIEARKQLANEIKELIELGNKHKEDKDFFDYIKEKLIEKIKPESEYSACSKAILAGYRNIDWIQNL